MEIIRKQISLNKGRSYYNWNTPFILNGVISNVFDESGNYGNIISDAIVSSSNKIIDIKDSLPLVDYKDNCVLRYRTMMDIYIWLNRFISKSSILRLCKRKENQIWVDEKDFTFYTLPEGTVFLSEKPYLPTTSYEIGNIIIVNDEMDKLISLFRKDDSKYRYEIDFLNFANDILKNPESINFSIPYINIPIYLEESYDSLGLSNDGLKFWERGKKYYLDESVYNINNDGVISAYKLTSATDYDLFEITKNEDYDLSQLYNVIDGLITNERYKVFYNESELEGYHFTNKYSYILCNIDNNHTKYYYVTPYYQGYYNSNKRKTFFDDDEMSHWEEYEYEYGKDYESFPVDTTLSSKLDTFIPFKRSYDDDGNALDFILNEEGTTSFLYSLGLYNKRTVNDTEYIDILYSIRTNTMESAVTMEEGTMVSFLESDFSDEDFIIEFVYYIGVEVDTLTDYNNITTGIKHTESYNLLHNETVINLDGSAITFTPFVIDKDNPISFITNDDMGDKAVIESDAEFIKQKITSVGFQDTPFVKDDYLIGIEDVKENINAYVTRGTASAFERHNILGEVKTFQDLENYRNDLFKLTETN